MDDLSEDRLNELTEEFRWRLRHIEGPLNQAELAEMEAELEDIIRLAGNIRNPGTGEASQSTTAK